MIRNKPKSLSLLFKPSIPIQKGSGPNSKTGLIQKLMKFVVRGWSPLQENLNVFEIYLLKKTKVCCEGRSSFCEKLQVFWKFIKLRGDALTRIYIYFFLEGCFFCRSIENTFFALLLFRRWAFFPAKKLKTLSLSLLLYGGGAFFHAKK